MNSHDVDEDARAEKSEQPEPSESVAPPTFCQRLTYAFGPVLAGMILDVVDFATFGPYGLIFGPFAGGFTGFVLATLLGLRGKTRIIVALASAVYCTMPFTEFIPVGTMVGAGVRFWQSGAQAQQPPEDEPTE